MEVHKNNQYGVADDEYNLVEIYDRDELAQLRGEVVFEVKDTVIVNHNKERAVVATVSIRYSQLEVQYEDGSHEVMGFHKVTKEDDK